MFDHRLLTELEFRLSIESLEILKVSRDILPFEITYINDRVFRCMVSDVPLSEADLHAHLVPARRYIAELLEQAGLTYTYYGVRLKVYEPNRKPQLCNFVSLVGGSLYGILYDIGGENHGPNVLIDRFDSLPDVGVKVVGIDDLSEDLRSREVDCASFYAMRRFMTLMPTLPLDMAWRPVPGCCANLFDKPMFEFVYRWVPQRVEERIFDALMQAFADHDITECMIGTPFLPIFSRKNRFSVSLLPGWTYPPRNLRSLPLCRIDPVLRGDAVVFFELL